MISATRSMDASFLAMCLVVAGGCTVIGIDQYGAEREKLEDARRLWQAQGWDSYAFTLQRLCFCAGGTDPAEVVVRNNERVSVTDIGTGEPIPAEFVQYYLTVPELFDFIEDAIDREAHEIDVSYDPSAGYPVAIQIDYIQNAIDEEMAFEASALRALR